jgi:LPXTG-motif cell wall-anchored protein
MADRLTDRTAHVIASRHSSAVKRVSRHRHAIMGSRYCLVIGAALALGMATTAPAQQNGTPDNGTPQAGGALRTFRLDPSRDPNRPRAPEREGPDIDTRLPSAQLPAPTPQAQPQTIPQRPVPVVAPPRIAPTVPQQTPARSQPPLPQTSPSPPPSSPRQQSRPAVEEARPAASSQPAPPSSTTAKPVPPVTTAPSPEPETSLAPTSVPETGARAHESWLLWIAGLLALAGLGWLLASRRRRHRRRRRSVRITQRPASGSAAPLRMPDSPSPMPPAPPAPELPRVSAAIAIEFEPLAARHTLVGASVGYKLTLRNDGEVSATDIAVFARIANADARQEAALAAFFAEADDVPIHRAEFLVPGEGVEFTGELRLANEAIHPIRMRERELLIPILAFSAHYSWAGEGRGYSGAAFIVGEESDPPTERMAPFRLDQGPRQYRSIGSRQARAALVT